MPARAVPLELEAKLLVPRARDVRAVARLTQLGSYRIQGRDTVRLHSVYLDTAALTLARHGVALRLRRLGERWEATAKWGGEVTGDVHVRPELTVALAGTPKARFAVPPGPLHPRLAALVAGRPLRPIVITDIRRQRFDVRRDGDPATAPSIAELALDRVQLRAPDGRRESYSEAEIELLHGTRRDVERLARQLRERFWLAPSAESKFARGLALIGHPDLRATAASQPLHPHDSLDAALRKIVARHLRRLRENDPGTRIGEDPEALHDMRVATRRLRSAVRTFAAGLPPRLAPELDEELQWLGGCLGGVRDLDVQLSNLARFASGAPRYRTALAPLREHLESERAARRAAMLAALDSTRYWRLLLRLERFALRASPRRLPTPRRESIARAGGRAVKKAVRRLLDRGRQIPEAPSADDLHVLRLRAKRVRYLLEFLRDVSGKPGRRLVKQLVRLQDLLGAHHDAVVAAERVRQYVERAGTPSGAATRRALGVLIASERRTAEQRCAEFQDIWRHFARKRTSRDLETLLRELRDADVPPSEARA